MLDLKTSRQPPQGRVGGLSEWIDLAILKLFKDLLIVFSYFQRMFNRGPLLLVLDQIDFCPKQGVLELTHESTAWSLASCELKEVNFSEVVR